MVAIFNQLEYQCTAVGFGLLLSAYHILHGAAQPTIEPIKCPT